MSKAKKFASSKACLDSLDDTYELCPNCASSDLFRDPAKVVVCNKCGFTHFVGHSTVRQALASLQSEARSG